MQERENSGEVLMARLEERFEQLLSAVNSIKQSLDSQIIKIGDIDRKIILIEQKDIQLEKDIAELRNNSNKTKQWILGIVATILGGTILAAIKLSLGI